jgi:hypothetical protein
VDVGVCREAHDPAETTQGVSLPLTRQLQTPLWFAPRVHWAELESSVVIAQGRRCEQSTGNAWTSVPAIPRNP